VCEKSGEVEWLCERSGNEGCYFIGGQQGDCELHTRRGRQASLDMKAACCGTALGEGGRAPTEATKKSVNIS